MNFPIARMSEVTDTAILNARTPPEGLTIPDWDDFNRFTGGLRPREFSIVCGPTGAGKTTFLAGLVAGLIDQNKKVFVAPVEVGEVSFTQAVLTQYGNGTNFASGEALDIQGQTALMQAAKKSVDKILNNLSMTTYSGRVEVDEMIEVLTYANDILGAQVAILDNLNYFLKPSKDGLLVMDEAIHSFVQFTKSHPIHTIMVMHPRKTEGGKITSEFDIKGSSTAVQEASNILLMNRLTDDEQEELNRDRFDREFVFKKLRLRGQYVNQKFYMRASNGRYEKSPGTFRANPSRGVNQSTQRWIQRVAASPPPAGENK